MSLLASSILTRESLLSINIVLAFTTTGLSPSFVNCTSFTSSSVREGIKPVPGVVPGGDHLEFRALRLLANEIGRLE